MPGLAAKSQILDLRNQPRVVSKAEKKKSSGSFLHISSLGILGGLLGVIGIVTFVPMLPAKALSPTSQNAAAPTSRTQITNHSIIPAKPVDRLVINRLGTNAPVVQEGNTPSGAIDTPKTLWQVGHYSKSATVGTSGTAVIVGHSGAPGQVGVFEHIDRIQAGDIITYKHADGSTISFRAVLSQAYPRNDATAQTLVEATIAPSLNLISCYGIWDSATSEYDQRWIVKALRID